MKGSITIKHPAWMIVMLLCVVPSVAFSQHHEHGMLAGIPSEKLGEVDFPVSCNAAVQKEFNRAMALFHSFWFEPARKSFARVLKHDPECGMAYWGIAFMSMGNPFAWPANPEAMKAGARALREARRVGVRTEREHIYIEALGVLFKDWETADYRHYNLCALQQKQKMRATRAL